MPSLLFPHKARKQTILWGPNTLKCLEQLTEHMKSQEGKWLRPLVMCKKLISRMQEKLYNEDLDSEELEK